MHAPHFVVVVPVKPPAIGKSRLRVPEHARPGLATAFALDVVAACRGVASVAETVVMTPDADFAATCTRNGVRTLPDGHGLNDGLRRAAAALRCDWPEAVPVALCADLPSLTSADLAAGLAAVDLGHAWFCADAQATGTTLYAAPYDAFDPRFGEHSRLAHERVGARPLPGDLTTLRRDVDDGTDLAEAVRLGTGSHTSAVLAELVHQ